MSNKDKKVAVGLSGGVDSAVAAHILMEKGFDVCGVTMSIWDNGIEIDNPDKKGCYGPGKEKDVEDAKKVADFFNIPFKVIDLRKEFREHIVGYFKNEYLSGKTPNPCIVCNRMLKFGIFLEKIISQGFDFNYFATGHYARIAETNGQFFLKKAVDESKDQTYFLQAVKKESLSSILFPLGTLLKLQVREIAKQINLSVAERPESQDFVSGGDYSPLFAEDKVEVGDIVDEKGKVLGRHKGIIHYTVGQRKGLGISSEKPLYVLKLDSKKNRVVVTSKEQLFSTVLTASSFNWLVDIKEFNEFRAFAKIRQKHREAPATVYLIGEKKVKVVFDEPQLSITPGQAVALYDGETLLGGGTID
ncbi:MAG: tRNA 2-thiouridine(34) synthase MnmA [bacterium]